MNNYKSITKKLADSDQWKSDLYFRPAIQFQSKIVGTLSSNAVFSLLPCLLVFPMLVVAVNLPNLPHIHWEGKKTVKCPNKFD